MKMFPQSQLIGWLNFAAALVGLACMSNDVRLLLAS